MHTKLVRVLLTTLLAFGVHSAFAGTWHILESPALIDAWPGPDGLWETADAGTFAVPGEGLFGPLPISGLTPSNFFTSGGAASSTNDTSGLFGTGVGTFVTNGGAPDHSGVNVITNYMSDGLFHNNFVPFVDFAAPLILDPAAINEVVVAPDGRTFTSTLTVDVPAAGLTTVFVGTGFNLYAGEDPSVVFSGNPTIAGHFEFLEPLTPAGWEILTTVLFDLEKFDLITGDPLGVTGTTVTVAYTFDSPDTDSDGIANSSDNCILIANADQRDTNGDGIGSACDPDLNNDCAVNFQDVSLFQAVFFTSDPDADFDNDGSVNFPDLAVLQQLFFGSPGPSANGCTPSA